MKQRSSTNKEKIEQSILATLAYFDLFDLPLTLLGLQRNLLISSQIFLVDLLTTAKRQSIIGHQQGYFFLRRRAGLIRDHLGRQAEQNRKWRIAVFAGHLIAGLPFVRAIAVVNTLSDSSARADSDIDFLIVIKSGRLWLSRFLITILMNLFRLRRHGYKIKDRVCLSFYITDQFLNLQSLQIKSTAYNQTLNINLPRDIYLLYWIANLKIIYSSHQTGRKFFLANKWILDYLANWYPAVNLPDFRAVSLPRVIFKLKSALEFCLSGKIGDCFNYLFKKIQLKKIYWYYYSKLKENTSAVVVNDNILKFHEQDRRQEISQKFNEALALINK